MVGVTSKIPGNILIFFISTAQTGRSNKGPGVGPHDVHLIAEWPCVGREPLPLLARPLLVRGDTGPRGKFQTLMWQFSCLERQSQSQETVNHRTVMLFSPHGQNTCFFFGHISCALLLKFLNLNRRLWVKKCKKLIYLRSTTLGRHS